MRLNLTIALFSLFTLPCFAKTVYIVPFYGAPDEAYPPLKLAKQRLEKSDYEVKFTHTAEDLADFSALIILDLNHERLFTNLSRYPKERCLFFIFEPPVVFPEYFNPKLTTLFGKIFTPFDDQIDNKHIFKFHFPQISLNPIPSRIPFCEKRLSTLVANNKDFRGHPNAAYEDRLKLIAFFETKEEGEFDLYGSGWPDLRCYHGCIADKLEVIKHYKFTWCYENMKEQKGYVSEKIFDAMIAGSVPIYLGASNIADYVPKTCFIDRRDFDSDESLVDFLKAMDETTYNKHLQEILGFLKSEKASLFSSEHFAQLIVDTVTHLNDPEPLANRDAK